jgi:glycosyltransferase involved in cell wall biosynthesis
MQRFEGHDIVCFANDWSGDPLSKKHVMRRLARRNRVLWVNSLGNRSPRATARDLKRVFDKLQRFAGGLFEVEPNIHVLSPLAVPNYRSPLMRRINRVVVGSTVRGAMRRLVFRRPLVYTFVPASAWVAGELGAERVVYHCVDEFSEFAGAGPEIAALEEELIRASDLVITCSQPLHARKAELNPKTVLVRHGVEHAHFARALDGATEIPDDVARLPRPRIGFYGLVAEWVDLEAIDRCAAAFPDGAVIVIGAVNNADRDGLARLHARPNVHLLGRRPYDALPGYCKAFDVALLPFVRNRLTENANPLKLREYLAAGLPVVASDIPEARALGQSGVYLARDAGASSRAWSRARSATAPAPNGRARRRCAERAGTRRWKPSKRSCCDYDDRSRGAAGGPLVRDARRAVALQPHARRRGALCARRDHRARARADAVGVRGARGRRQGGPGHPRRQGRDPRAPWAGRPVR